ncbi:MAG: UDP-4-amino-4,6-dideoxy-N-acetyl-beta-L-altrosamine transaminase [Oleispira sp.]
MPDDINYIPYGKQAINDDDISAVIDVLKSDFLTQGPVVPKFEQAVTEYCQAKYGIAVNSATSALHIACLALEVGQGDLVWTSATTFVASSNCALYCGAEVDFLDINPRTFNIDVKHLEEKLQLANEENRLPKVVIVVHMCGQPCDMEEIHTLSKKYKFKIIEDAAHAIGSSYKEFKTGSCQFSDITTFSFHPVKIITTAEGGLAVTNNEVLANKMRLLRNHGITREESEMVNQPVGGWYYEQIMLGFNYRMTELQAALGLSQLSRLDGFVTRRNELAKNYNDLLKALPIEVPFIIGDRESSFHLYVICLKLDEIKLSHRDIFSKLRSFGIGVNLHYMPVYLQPYYQGLNFSEGKFVKGYCVEAESYANSAISLPLFPSLALEDQVSIVAQLKELLCQ